MIKAKLWKRIVSEGINHTLMAEDTGETDSIEHDIIKSPIIVDHAVQTSVLPRTGWSEFNQLKFLAVPFPAFFVEGGMDIREPLDFWRWEWRCRARGSWGAAVSAVGVEGGGFHVRVHGVEAIYSKPIALTTSFSFFLDGTGSVVTDARGVSIHSISRFDRRSTDKASVVSGERLPFGVMARRVANRYASYVGEILERMGCKNVGMERVANDPRAVRLAERRVGSAGGGYRYYVLTVKPPGSGPGVKGVPLGVMPQHVCRGHFSEYGPQFGKGKLFGKLEGRFFIPPHMKGKKENGIAEKDYLVPA